MAKQKQIKTCRWKGCNKHPISGALLCEIHVIPSPPDRFPAWIRELPFVIGTSLAGSLLYDMLKILADHASFSDPTAEKVNGMMHRLKLLGGHDLVASEVSRFVEATQDPGFSKDMAKILMVSAKYEAESDDV
ncbi:MAG: hypothetical protein OJJ21_06520 [Ferrovibrio sp.]|uniref:hypothetical protein n=1 Tax=Ferrovibrio sp. TaxID=1917215 RepID=UPI00262F0103|nr:hypothetical protein [Ferrovibrio sp.]MCW0233232.1 hypothetical protein [Ferrovibrio sp.]